MKLAIVVTAFIVGFAPSIAASEGMTLKEMTEDALRRTIALSDQVRSADARARGELGTAEITATPETPGSERSTSTAGNPAGKR